jgi:PKD repeat protein
MDGTPLACTNVVVDILTDTWGSETTWSIVDTATGTSYASGGPYPDALIANYVDTICLPEGIWYEFRINDSYGDGLFDGTNTGTYSVDILCSWGNNNVISGSGAFPFGGPSGTAPSWDSTVFEVTCIVTCPDPDSLMAVADCDEAILSWTSDPSSTGSTIQWGPAGFTPGTGNIITNATSPYNLTGLSVGTSYDFWVVDSCVSGSASSYVGPYTFTTDTLPIAVISANQNASPHPDTVQYGFSALGSVNGNSYWWDFGDGSANDTNMFAIHNYGQNGSYTVTLVVTNDCGSDTATQTIIVSGIGIDEYGFGNISLYPNPNDGYFTLSGLLSFGDDAKIEVITMTGTVVYSEKIVANGSETFVIDLRGYAPGVYQVRVSSKAGVGTKPFVLRN